ncbi:hypothetical protein Tco_0581878 [Tanacetum coccineum]
MKFATRGTVAKLWYNHGGNIISEEQRDQGVFERKCFRDFFVLELILVMGSQVWRDDRAGKIFCCPLFVSSNQHSEFFEKEGSTASILALASFLGK